MFVDKKETCPSGNITAFIRQFIPNLVVERKVPTEMIFGIRRNESGQIGQLVHALDAESANIGVESYGLSMTTIEDVFLK